MIESQRDPTGRWNEAIRPIPFIHPNKTQSNSINIPKNKLALSLVAVLSFSASAFAGDQENIQGTWKSETVSLDGKPMPVADVLYIFAGESLTVHSAAGKDQHLTFTLDAASKPKFLVNQVMQSAPGAKPERIPYELSGDTLKIMPISPNEHVTEVSDKGHVLITLKRIASQK